MDKNKKAVYLTFDDGPIPESTPFILETLAKYDARATFFMVGDNVRKYPQLFKRIIYEGHQVGGYYLTVEDVPPQNGAPGAAGATGCAVIYWDKGG